MSDKIRTKRRRVTVASVGEPPPGFSSNCFVVGDQVFINGLTARDALGNACAIGNACQQARVLFSRMQALMEAAGGTMGDIVKMTCYLTDVRHRDDFAKARQEFFSGDFPPCVVIGGVSFTTPELLIEVDALAILGSGP